MKKTSIELVFCYFGAPCPRLVFLGRL